MASSSSSTVASSERTSHFISQTKMEMQSSKACHWSQLDYSTINSEWSTESNSKYFDLLKEDPQWGRFFRDFGTLEVGEKISEGAQADVYEARMTPVGPFNLVVKVMKGDAPLKAFQVQWPIGMLSARSKYKHLFDLPLITILGGTVLHDKRLRGRFAFVMYRRWGDLRLLIDHRMKQERNTPGPFPIEEAIHLMLSIARDMDILQNNHDIVHRDLKASNVLVWGESREDMSLVATSNKVERIGSVVADFECSVGVLGTRFWRAPEILQQLKDRIPSAEVQFTHSSDVYSYGMTCYEIVTGCIPFDGLRGEDTISQILNGQRPKLPHDVPKYIRNIIACCWHCEPSERPTFSDICMALKLKRGPNPISVVIDNTFKGGASIVKVEQWNNPQPLTLLEVMQKLTDMDLSVSYAYDSSSTETITQYFEVMDCKGKKVVNDKSIANIKMVIIKTLSSPTKMKWISESVGISIDGNTGLQIHGVEVVVESSASFLEAISKVLVASNFQVHSTESWTQKGRVKCVIFVEGARMGTILWKLGYEMGYGPIFQKQFKIIVHRFAAKEISHWNRRLHNLKSKDLILLHIASNIRVYQRKEFEGSHSINVVVHLDERHWLIDMSRSLGRLGYKIVGASVEYPGPYKFLKGKTNKTEDIDVETLGEDEFVKISRILDIATEHGCLKVNGQLRVSGPNEELHDDLMKGLQENGLIIVGGQIYWDCGPNYYQCLEFFVTKDSTLEAS